MGNINVFIGPMRCGKTNRILMEANKLSYTGKKVNLFKPEMDNRFSTCEIQDRNGNTMFAYNIKNMNDLLKYKDSTDIYVIDEFQFLDGDIQTIISLKDLDKQFYIAGLSLTAERKPFGKMGDILCVADHIEFLNAVCENCRRDNAIYTFCKVAKTEDVLVGDDVYIPLCGECYKKLMR